MSEEVAAQVTVGAREAKRLRKPKQLAVIDQGGCTGCEVCIEYCPVDCIHIVPGPEHHDRGRLVEVDLEECIGCTLCAKYCPWDTIFMLPYADAVDIAPDLTVRTAVYADRPYPEP